MKKSHLILALVLIAIVVVGLALTQQLGVNDAQELPAPVASLAEIEPAAGPDDDEVSAATAPPTPVQTSPAAVKPTSLEQQISAPQKVEPVLSAETAQTTKLVKSAKANFENYSVSVHASKELKIPGPPGELKVWIGETGHLPEIQDDMVAGVTALNAVGETAKITPFTLGIDVEPTVSKCEKIIATGSQVRFKLIPVEAGTFTVGADVELYDSADCSGPPVPKSAKSVKVEVAVEIVGLITDGGQELAGSTWQAFLDFWDKLLILIFALLLFLIRKKLFKWFGFKSGAD